MLDKLTEVVQFVTFKMSHFHQNRPADRRLGLTTSSGFSLFLFIVFNYFLFLNIEVCMCMCVYAYM